MALTNEARKWADNLTLKGQAGCQHHLMEPGKTGDSSLADRREGSGLEIIIKSDNDITGILWS